MDGKELYFADGKPSGWWVCSVCKHVDNSLEYANNCCQPRKCACGVKLGGRAYPYNSCEACRNRNEQKRESDRFALAKKLTPSEWDGPIFTRSDNFYMDLEDYLDQREDKGETYVWCTTPIKFEPDVHNMLESALDEHHEDAYDNITSKEIADLQKHVDEWAEKQCITSHEIDYKRCVIIEAEADTPHIVS
jgi:hypothetical protein